MNTPDQTFIEEVLSHGRKQLEKGWTPLSTAGNLRARFGLTEDCGRRIVGSMMASRVGPTVQQLATELATALELSMEEATARVMEVRKGIVDPDDWSTIHLEFDPDRAASIAPPGEKAPLPHPRTTPREDESDAESVDRSPVRLEMNLLPDQDDEKRKKRGLFGRR